MLPKTNSQKLADHDSRLSSSLLDKSSPDRQSHDLDAIEGPSHTFSPVASAVSQGGGVERDLPSHQARGPKPTLVINMAGAKLTAQACDGCRVRKVKCDGGQPCGACAHFNVNCVKSQAPKKRKNPVRGRLLAQVRGDNVPWAAGSPTSPSAGALPSFAVSPGAASGSSPPSAVAATYTTGFFRALIPDFETLVYPFSPAFSSADIAEAISTMHENPEDLALVYAFAAVTTFLSRTSALHQGERWSQFVELVKHSLQAHQHAALNVEPAGSWADSFPATMKRIMTCIYLEISMMGFKRLDHSFALIREAISLIQVLEARNRSLGEVLQPPKETLRFHQLYWEAYIHERYLTIAAGFPSILPPIQARLSATEFGTPDHIQLGFNCLIDLFLVLDDRFLMCWNAPSATAPEVSAEWIEYKQAQLDDVEMQATNVELRLLSTGQAGLSERQHADLFITRLWLRTVLWQLALSQGLLSSDATHEGLSLQFPASRLSTQLRNLVNRLNSILSIATQGSGIVQKLFEITSTVGDVLAFPEADGQSDSDLKSHVEDFVYVVHFLLELEEMREHQKAYLRDKARQLQQRQGIWKPIENAELQS
ncbi:putative sucrose utilization protein SUC1 [Paramyrothecium foliicola]|nr:putative sucrose utilization protein SUC1 [Paramyrothecium foliicola]